jgi:HTH-type transcriptional regulator/antitoxin HigA
METVNEDTPETDSDFIELDLLADLVEEYEMEHYPVEEPLLADVLKLSMYEMNLNQKTFAKLLGISASRLSEYIAGKAEPTLKIARRMHKTLKIDANIILGSA